MPRNRGTSRKGKPKRHDRDAGMGRSLARAHGGGGAGRPKRTYATHPGGGMMSAGAASIGIDTGGSSSATGGEGGGNRMKSVLETDDLTDFLHRAEMAGREFEVERGGFVVVDETAGQVVPQQELQRGQQRQPPEFRHVELSVPRRPEWDESTTAEQLNRLENESFLEWRRAIAAQEEALYHASSLDGNNHGATSVVVTPFEKNLEVWRQLWRVLERCDVLVQIVDARNPLFYLSDDLRRYAEDELGKPMVVLVNKADYLTAVQRLAWHDYLMGRGVEHMFFSAYLEQQKLDERAAGSLSDAASSSALTPEAEEEKTLETTDTADDVGVESPLTRAQLQTRLLNFATSKGCVPSARYGDRIQFGTVGFPNVGKSSVINVLVGSSKRSHGETSRVAVASQPGKTKHFQTVLIPDSDSMMLCDCPGLVFPSFVRGGSGDGRADLIAAGVYPIAQMREARPVVELICRRIPRAILAAHYGIRLPPPSSERSGLSSSSSASTVSAEELLDSYCEARSLLTAASGNYDHQAASRVVVRDYVEGRLLYCHPPPHPGVGGDGDGGGGRSDDEDVDAVFLSETVLTALRRTERLGERLMNDGVGELASLKIANGGGRGDDEGDGVNALEVKEEDDEGDDSSRPVAQVDDVDVDFDILDVLAGGDGDGDDRASISGEADRATKKKGNRHKSIRKHGRKGRKDRDNDPYGCHTGGDADSFLSGVAAGRNTNKIGKGSGGVIVNAGKYGGAGYTRPTSYAGARSAVQSDSGRHR